MAFHNALTLILKLEGGIAHDPEPTKNGMTQSTWVRLGGTGSVLDAGPVDIANAYRKLWDGEKIYSVAQVQSIFTALPEPADSVAFQMFCNLPYLAALKLIQNAVGVLGDGKLGNETSKALRAWNGHGVNLAEKILALQLEHYTANAEAKYLPGLANRVATVEEWLGEQ